MSEIQLVNEYYLLSEIERLQAELQRYKQLEDEGRLVELPVALGSTIYTIDRDLCPCEDCEYGAKYGDSLSCYEQTKQLPEEKQPKCPPPKYTIEEHFAKGFTVGYSTNGADVSDPGEWGYEGLETFYGYDFKWYATREAAEKALKEGVGND